MRQGQGHLARWSRTDRRRRRDATSRGCRSQLTADLADDLVGDARAQPAAVVAGGAVRDAAVFPDGAELTKVDGPPAQAAARLLGRDWSRGRFLGVRLHGSGSVETRASQAAQVGRWWLGGLLIRLLKVRFLPRPLAGQL